MKNENLIRGIGEVDDRILERYNDIDTRLAEKHAKKATMLHVLAAAACVAILLCACTPLAMLTSPVGRAVLKRDSDALMAELAKIDGFYDWQAQTAERLEAVLPEEMWERLQTTPVLDVLTQPQFKGLTPMGSFDEGEPYRLYFTSNGDGTCTLQYITTNPDYEGDFVLEIPETSPDGDVVTEININQTVRSAQGQHADFPYVLTVETFESLLATAQENNISDFNLGNLQAYYLKLSVSGLDEQAYLEMTDAFPITAVSDVYVFDGDATAGEQNKIYAFLTEYCEWDAEKYEQSIDEIFKLAKQDGDREKAELYLTILQNASLGKITGITIPKTVRSIDQSTWASLPALKTVTVAADHPTFQMTDGCLVDTETGALKLYLRADGKFPAGADIRSLDTNAFSLCTLQANADMEGELHLPEGVTHISANAFADISVADGYTVHIYLPAGLESWGCETIENVYYRVVYHYPGTMEEWEHNVSFDTVKGDIGILLQTSDLSEPVAFRFPRAFD